MDTMEAAMRKPTDNSSTPSGNQPTTSDRNPLADHQNSLTAGLCGPLLLQDCQLIETTLSLPVENSTFRLESRAVHEAPNEILSLGSQNGGGAACAVSSQPAVTMAIVTLLEFANKALLRDAKEASRCITEATSLLRAECDLHEERGSGRAAGPLAPWQISRVLKYLEANLPNSIRVEDFAGAAQLSVSYFSYAFRCTVGESPLRYVRRRRIERAQALMLLTDKSLAEIAVECGLADQSHLTKTFGQIVGMSPGAWRRARRSIPRPISREPRLTARGIVPL
jgi:AraC family transcriptional regulator